MTNKHSIFNIVKRLNKGEKPEDIEKEVEVVGKKRARGKNKIWGKCDSCEQKTVLVADVGLCGPCCFGEADTYNGNF